MDIFCCISYKISLIYKILSSVLTICEVAMCVMCCSITFNNSTNSPKNSKVEGDYPHLAAAPLCVV